MALGICYCRQTGISLPNNQRQYRSSHAPKDVKPLHICASNCAPCQPLLRAFPGWWERCGVIRVSGFGLKGPGSRVWGADVLPYVDLRG